MFVVKEIGVTGESYCVEAIYMDGESGEYLLLMPENTALQLSTGDAVALNGLTRVGSFRTLRMDWNASVWKLK